MPSTQEIEQYLNLLARALSVADQFSAPFYQMPACHGYSTIENAVAKALNSAWKKGLPSFFAYLERIIQNMEKESTTENCIRATAACLWMDRHICYIATGNPMVFSLHKLLPLKKDKPICTGPINTNYLETHIQLHPRYEVTQFYDQTADRMRPLANRDAFEGLNGKLEHICYSHWDGRHIIHHVIVPGEYGKNKENQSLRIAFCPLSDQPDLLKCTKTQIVRDGIIFDGIQVDGVKYAKFLRARFIRDWNTCCDCGADIMFGPEMLGTRELDERNGRFHKLLRPLSMETLAQKKKPPMLTFLPSYWRDGVNSTTVVYRNGTILGSQLKYTPYVNVGHGHIEALLQQNEQHFLVIHIPGAYRIVVMICADFLSIQSPSLRRLICEELCATMILVPSYSHGEQDFINLLPSLQSYGTTVVWGDCCGAVTKPRIIGAASIAGIDHISRFGSQCQCEGICKSTQSCIFLVNLPLQLTRAKPDAPEWEQVIAHISH